MRPIALALVLGSLLAAGGCKDKDGDVGGEREPCYPNNTCQYGLICASGFCVRPPDGWFTPPDDRDCGVMPDQGTLDGVADQADGPATKLDTMIPDAPITADLPDASTMDPTPYFTIDLWSGGAKAALSFTLDEGLAEPYNLLMPQVEAQGWKMSFFVYTQQADQEKAWNLIIQAHKNGHEVANHTFSHPDLTKLSAAQIDNELKLGNDALKKHLGAGAALQSFAYPYEETNSNVWKVVQMYHRYARGGDGGKPVPPNPLELNDAKNPNWGDLAAKANTSDIPLANWNSWIDTTVKSGKWFIEEWHGVCNNAKTVCGGWKPRTIDEFRKHFAHIKSFGSDLWVAPMGQVGRYIEERENAPTFTIYSWSAAKAMITLTTGSTTPPFDVPLSYVFKPPAAWGWQNIMAVQGGKVLKSEKLGTNQFRIHSLPHKGLPVTITSSSPSPCTPETDAAFCTRVKKNCGKVVALDNCGAARTASCGACTAPQICGAGGTPGVCGACNHPAVVKSCAGGVCSIPAGCFFMGSPVGETCRNTAFEDYHPVRLTHGFDMGQHEVTQGEFSTLMKYSPAKFSSCGTNCPVEQVTWSEAAAYCNALSTKAGLSQCYQCTGSQKSAACSPLALYADIYTCKGWRLPTEAEWEYAYRAGTTTGLYSGNLSNCMKDSGAGNLAWYQDNSGNMTHAVGTKAANAWGLHDMAGNVAEWTNDTFRAHLGNTAITNPQSSASATSGGLIAVRGGCWYNASSYLRAAARDDNKYHTATYFDAAYGFRCVRSK